MFQAIYGSQKPQLQAALEEASSHLEDMLVAWQRDLAHKHGGLYAQPDIKDSAHWSVVD